MRTKHAAAAKESSNLYAGTSDPILSPQRPFAKHAELRKNEGKILSSARGKSKCASVRESSRSGGTTPRCVSESPSPKCEVLLDAETPRTYLIKDSFFDPDCKLAAELSAGKSPANASAIGRNVITCVSPISRGNKFLSEIEEVEWFYDEDRVLGGGTSCSSADGRGISVGEEDERLLSRELRRLKGKAQVDRLDFLAEDGCSDRRGKAPMAFPTEEELGSREAPSATTTLLADQLSTATTTTTTTGICEEEEERRTSFVDVPPDLPPWLQNAYRNLTRLDDEDDSYRISADPGAASCSSSLSKWQWKAQVEELRSSCEKLSLQEDCGGAPVEDQEVDCLRDDQNGQQRSEIRKVIFGEPQQQEEEQETSGGSREVKEEEVEEGQQGTGWLWKMSLCASVSFVTWVLMNGARIQCRSLFPTIREREQPVKIIRRSSRPTKFYEAEESS